MQLEVPPSGLIVATDGGSPATVRVRRFAATAQPLPGGSVAAATTAVLRPPGDRSPVPWHAELASAGTVRACSR
jgi:hypothetical protein